MPLSIVYREPMDSLFMDQHFLRSSLRLYSGDPLDAENNNAGSLFSAAMMEKARAHIQMWGRATGGASPYSPGELHALLLSGGGGTPSAQQVYLGQRAAAAAAAGMPLGMWSQGATSPWHQSHQMHGGGLPPGLLGPPAPHRPQMTPPPPPLSSTPSSSGSPSPTSISTSSADLRLPKAMPAFPSMHRFSPYAPRPANQPSVSPIARSSQ